MNEETNGYAQRDRGVFESTTDGLVISDWHGNVVEVNPAFCAMHGYVLHDRCVTHPRDFVHAGSQSVYEELMATVHAGRPFEGLAAHIRKDGTGFPVEVHATAFSYMGAPHILIVLQDITQRMEAFDLLEQRVEERTRELAEAMAGQAAIAAENARLYEQAQTTARNAAGLARIASRVALGGSLQTTLADLCEYVVGLTGAVAAAIGVLDPQTERVHFAGSHGLPAGYPEATNSLLAAGVRMMAHAAFAGREPVVVPDMRRLILDAPQYAPLHRFMPIVPWDTVVAMPMIYQGRPMGVLLGYHLRAHVVGEAEIAFYRAIAHQAAIALENARLMEQVQGKAALEERQRLARELHDSVTQELFSISLTARSISLLLEREGVRSPAIAAKMADLAHLTEGALAEMRALIFELRPGALEEEGLLQAVRKHAAAVQGRELMPVEVVADEAALPRLKPPAEEALYRIAQEALHNVVKHARANRVAVSLAAEHGDLLLRIADDGVGFDPRVVPPGHLGLGTMGQRAAALNGTYRVESAPGAGTTVLVRVPLGEWQQRD